MNLLIDIGNTRTKWLMLDGGAPHARGVLGNHKLKELDFTGFQVSASIASCVANERVFNELALRVREQLELELQRAVVTDRQGQLLNAYRRRDQLGVDRWLAAIGAHSLIQDRRLIVVDAGTAVTVDLVTADNVFQGGVILPGIRLIQECLTGNTAGVVSAPSDVRSVVGRTTQECVNAGAQFGVAGAIERYIREMTGWSGDGGSDVPCVLMCGGDAERLSALLPIEHRVEVDLVFSGLSVVLS
ncbi:type III pantothenate kinase [Arenicella chitinivorans]|uniref:Type III pantothenate kinase n=1 Tax=Arenicella chitinivorans TaxID=1329800 RepID=A0A918RPJ4_9GAMM|nr:type III pantothenate kinase [Arenicella chitinivorans]GHA05279.1 type III pantothenate kinase [Arenicella chitinivorans]